MSDKIIRENALEVNPEEMREFMRQQVMDISGSMNLGEDTSWLDSCVENAER